MSNEWFTAESVPPSPCLTALDPRRCTDESRAVRLGASLTDTLFRALSSRPDAYARGAARERAALAQALPHSVGA